MLKRWASQALSPVTLMITLLLSSLKSGAKVQLIIDIGKEKGIYLAKIRFSCNIGFFEKAFFIAWFHPACCNAKPHPLDLSSLIVHVLGVACIYNRDGIALYRIGKIPLVCVGHVISFPTFKRWFTS